MVKFCRIQVTYMHPTSNKKVFGGKWWRFDRYELKRPKRRGDWYIRPVEGLPLRSYEPWDAYHTPHGKETRKQPYHSLLELVRSIDSGELDPNERDLAITDWCGKYGPLGVLLSTNRVVGLTGFEHGRSLGWGSVDWGLKATSPRPDCVPGDKRVIGSYLTDFGSLAALHSDHVNLAASLGGPGNYSPPIGVSVLDYFTEFSNKRGYSPPAPICKQFWREYSEPVETFLGAGRVLLQVVKKLQATRDSKKSLVEKRAAFSERIKLLIESLVTTVRPIIHLETKSHFGLSWEGESLWSDFAMMAVLDFANNRPLVCGNSKCGAFFVTKSTEAKYCSGRCRGTVQMRKYRESIARRAKGNAK